jgi:type IV pilus assembly protein PilM
MFNLFSGKSKIGIDIGTSAIKIVELAKKTGRFELVNYGLFELKSFNDAAGKQGLGHSILKFPDEEIVWGIKELMKKAGIGSKDVVASIPSFSTFSTVIEMPYLQEQDLAKAIPIEAKKYIPLPLSEVVIDWSIIGVKTQAGAPAVPAVPATSATPGAAKVESTAPRTTIEVFLAAVPKAETLRYQNIMRQAGLNLKALELENSSLIRALLGNDLSPTAIVNIGGRSTSILIVSKGYERISHNYEVGGFEITKTIARSLNVSLEKAEELKRQFGLKDVNENVVDEAMSSLVDMMAFETKKTITNFEDSAGGEKISKVVLTGGLTNMPNFAEYFKQKIGRDVFVGNVFSRVIYNQALGPIIPELGNVFATATGLAMRDI